jgi:ribonucleoside-diphosphate reductase alpha chain
MQDQKGLLIHEQQGKERQAEERGNGKASEEMMKQLKQGKSHLEQWRRKMEELHGKVGGRPKLPEDLLKGEWTEQAVRVLEERYLDKDEQGKVTETADEMCWRVAWEMAVAEAAWGGNRERVMMKAREYYQLMASRKFLPNSPTLMNAGKNNALQYSACYVIPVGDSLEEIFDGVKYQAVVHQSGGGTGFSFSRLRPKGSRVKSSRGVASGPVSFMRVYNEATQQIKQGGTRRGANMGILRVDHPDVMEFIRCKDKGGITNFNISVAMTDGFMEAYFADEEYELKEPRDGRVVEKLKAREVFEEIASGAWRTGDPGVIFLDRINNSPANPIRKGGWVVESTNPCGEQPLYPFDACNLGSIFLGRFVREEGGRKQVDWEELRKAVHTSVEFLDSVIEMNPFPLAQIKEMVSNIRRIGLGVGGWADMLVELGIAYDSNQALELGERIMKFINDEGHEASRELAKTRMPFPLYKESIYKDDPVRNSTVTTIAPTGSISIIAGSSSGIEPLYAVSYRHIVKDEGLDRKLTFIDANFEKVAKERGFYSEELKEGVAKRGTVRGLKGVPMDVQAVFGTAHEIDFTWHVKMQAAFQKHVDNAVSKTINLPNEATEEDIKEAYLLAWETGCRGITVFRDGSKGAQVLNTGVEEKRGKKEVAGQAVGGGIVPRPVKVEGATYKIATPMGSAFVTVNHTLDGNPFEVFVAVGKAGSEVSAMAEALGRLISTTLRFGNHLPAKERAAELVAQLRGIGGSKSVGFGKNRVRSLPDAVAKAIAMHFGLLGFENGGSSEVQENGVNQVGMFEGNGVVRNEHDEQLSLAASTKKIFDLCPECKELSLVLEEGCKKCYSCGYSEC